MAGPYENQIFTIFKCKNVCYKFLNVIYLYTFLDRSKVLFYLCFLLQHQGKGDAIHPLHRHLDISWVIIAEKSPVHIASSRIQIRSLWFLNASCWPLSYTSLQSKIGSLLQSRPDINKIWIIAFEWTCLFSENSMFYWVLSYGFRNISFWRRKMTAFLYILDNVSMVLGRCF